jgi:hypothetical protein
MQVDNPLYDINETTDFNINFMKKDESSLTLSKAKKQFVQLSGFNVIYAYNFLKSLLYSENTIACNIVQTQRLVADEIICNSIISANKTIDKNACYIYFDNMSIPLSSVSNKISIYGKSDTIENLIIPNEFKIIVSPNHKIVIYDNKRIVETITSHNKQYYKHVKVKNFTYIIVKSY